MAKNGSDRPSGPCKIPEKSISSSFIAAFKHIVQAVSAHPDSATDDEDIQALSQPGILTSQRRLQTASVTPPSTVTRASSCCYPPKPK